MAVQSVDTLVQLGRPQATHRADQQRISQVQIRFFVLGLMYLVGFGSLTLMARLFQQSLGMAGQTGIAFPVAVGCSVLVLGATAVGIRKLSQERRTHAIVHDNGVYVQTSAKAKVARWEDVSHIDRVPISNSTALAEGWFQFYFTWLLANRNEESCLISLKDGSKVLVPSHLEDFERLAKLLEARYPGK
jgi:hypothetical protein